MRGSEAIALIREHEQQRPAHPASVIVMVTGVAQDELKSVPADAVWTKPFPDFTNGVMQRQLSALLHASSNREEL